MPTETPDTRAVATQRRPAPAAPAAPAPRRLGLALAVIATAQLMVALDLTIVTVALPHIQTALGFSGTNLEWVVNAYAVAFGGLLLLGGRSGDLLGRRRVLIAGLLVFVAASLLGGLATGQAWLITARAVQGAGAAMAAPAALSLIAVTFPEGPRRNRAMAVYSAMAILGVVAGLVAGGLLVTYANWRWVFFVNVPIGLAVAALATRVLPATGRRAGRFDLPGAITATAGVAALVYGLSNAATTPDGVALGRRQGGCGADRRRGAAGRVRGDGDRVLPGLPGLGGCPGAGRDHRAGHDPGQAPGPVRRGPDVRTSR